MGMCRKTQYRWSPLSPTHNGRLLRRHLELRLLGLQLRLLRRLLSLYLLKDLRAINGARRTPTHEL